MLMLTYDIMKLEMIFLRSQFTLLYNVEADDQKY